MSTSEIFPGIVSDSEILGGKAVIKGIKNPSYHRYLATLIDIQETY